MITIKLKDILPGMILAKDVKDRSGRILLIAGNRLSENHAKIFRSWGITEICTESEVSSIVPERKIIDTESDEYKKAEKELRGLFRYTDMKNPVVKEMFQLSLERKMLKLSSS